jgi:transglutaminase-like putative cysteine protease
VRHETQYRYDGEVAHSHQQLHLTPRATERQQCLSHLIEVLPVPSQRTEHADAFGNIVTRVELERPHEHLDVSAQMRVQLEALPALDLTDGEAWESVRDQLRYNAQSRSVQWLEAMRFRGESPYVRIKRVFSEFAQDCLLPGASVLSVANAVMAKVHREFRYEQGVTEIATPLMEVLAKRRGVCQDFAHLMIASLRSAGLAARYVSGYLYTRAAPATRAAPVAEDPATDESSSDDCASAPRPKPDSKPESKREVTLESRSAHSDAGSDAAAAAPPAVLGADASHAWVSVFAPPYGWIGFDPTNNLVVNQEHVVLAWGRDFGDVSPLRGMIVGGGRHKLAVDVGVRRIG